MAVVTIAGLKGGIGKTTITTGLGTLFHASGARTLIVDADPRKMAWKWGQIGLGAGHSIPPVEKVVGTELAEKVPDLAAGVEVVLIDAPPSLDPDSPESARAIKEALLLAHVVLLPVIPGAYDIWVLQETLGLLAEARKTRPDLRAFIVPNCLDHTKASEFMTSSLPKLGLPIIGKGLRRLAAHRDVALAGTGVSDFAPTSPAADEMRSLFKAVRTALATSATAAKPKKRRA